MNNFPSLSISPENRRRSRRKRHRRRLLIMRHMNNLESVFTYEGTNDIHKLVIGEKSPAIAAFV